VLSWQTVEVRPIRPGIAAAELSTLVFITPVVAVLLPLARFAGFAWMLLVGATLPKSKEKSRTLQ
jgi:hypothetical protein